MEMVEDGEQQGSDRQVGVEGKATAAFHWWEREGGRFTC